MPTAINLDGGPLAGEQMVPDSFELTTLIGFPLDENLRPLKGGEPFAVAIYQVLGTPEERTYQFAGFQQPASGAFPVRFIGGPAEGTLPAPQPAQYIEPEQKVPLLADGSPFRGAGEPAAFAIYDRHEIEGKSVFVFREIDDSEVAKQAAVEEVNEQRIQMAIDNFYANPNYDIYSIKPTGEHEQVAVEVGHRRGHVDIRMAPLIAELWRLNMDTIGSCQERPPGSKNAGKAYVGLIRMRDARFVLDLLTKNGVLADGHEKKFNIARKFGPAEADIEQMSFDTMNILLNPTDIDRATQLLRDVTHR